MATNLSQWERERFNYGDAANDKKGDPIRVHAIKAEHTDNLIFTWLSGGRSEVRLPDALPIERGGTGATSVASAVRNLGYFEDCNFCLRRGIKVLTTNGTSITDRFKNLPNASITRVSTGVYNITGITHSTDMWSHVVPLNTTHQPVLNLEFSPIENGVQMKVNIINYVNGAPVMGTLIDLPSSVKVDIECK